MKFACIALLIAVAAAAPTKTQSLTSKVRGMHSVSTTFTGLGAGASCKVAVQARQTDYDWKRTEWLQVHAHGAKFQALNANCGFTKQCSHSLSKCSLKQSRVVADRFGKITIRGSHSRGVNYCPYKGYYMWASVSLKCTKSSAKTWRDDILGDYVRTYTCKDGHGNQDKITRTWRVIDTKDPEITVIGRNPIYYEASRDSVYTDSGAECKDYTKGAKDNSVHDVNWKYNLNDMVKVGGDVVNLRVPGTYTIKYDCADISHNKAPTATRKVIVKDSRCPRVKLTGKNVIYIEAGFKYTDAGATATDDLDGFIKQCAWKKQVKYTAKTQNIMSRTRGMHTASTTFTGLGAGATCRVQVNARQTDYNWKRTEWLQVHSVGAKFSALNANCGFTKQCSHSLSKCNLRQSIVTASSSGKVTIRATHGRGVDFCPYKGYYMWATVTLNCNSGNGKYANVLPAKRPVNGHGTTCVRKWGDTVDTSRSFLNSHNCADIQRQAPGALSGNYYITVRVSKNKRLASSWRRVLVQCNMKVRPLTPGSSSRVVPAVTAVSARTASSTACTHTLAARTSAATSTSAGSTASTSTLATPLRPSPALPTFATCTPTVTLQTKSW